MSPAPDPVARCLPQWRELAQLAQLAAQSPDQGEMADRLQGMAERAAGNWKGVGAWASPFVQPRDQYVGAALIWLAKAYGRQGSEAMRHSLALALEHLALAFLGRLERAAGPLERAAEPAVLQLPLRRRRDIDDIDIDDRDED